MIGATDQRTTSGPADSILRAKGRRHDRTHDPRNAKKIALDQRAASRHDTALAAKGLVAIFSGDAIDFMLN